MRAAFFEKRGSWLTVSKGWNFLKKACTISCLRNENFHGAKENFHGLKINFRAVKEKICRMKM